MKLKSKANHIDVYVGQRVRALRLETDMVQQELSKKIGVSYQQLQKYEHGRNRIAASVLYKIAGVFDVNVDYFFPNYKESE